MALVVVLLSPVDVCYRLSQARLLGHLRRCSVPTVPLGASLSHGSHLVQNANHIHVCLDQRSGRLGVPLRFHPHQGQFVLQVFVLGLVPP